MVSVPGGNGTCKVAMGFMGMNAMAIAISNRYDLEGLAVVLSGQRDKMLIGQNASNIRL